MKQLIKTSIAAFIFVNCQLCFNCLGQANEPGSGNALRFDGNDWVGNIGTQNDFSFVQNTGVFTIECWSKLNSLVDKEYFLVANTATGVETGFFFESFVTSGTARMRINILHGSGSVILSDSQLGVISDMLWHHLAVVGDGTNIIFYVDGIAYPGSGTMTGFATGVSSRLLQIGDGYSAAFGAPGAFNYNGLIDEVRIWNRALTQTEIQANMCRKLPDCADPTLVSYWRFDEGVDNTCSGGQDVCDASCNGNHGTKF